MGKRIIITLIAIFLILSIFFNTEVQATPNWHVTEQQYEWDQFKRGFHDNDARYSFGVSWTYWWWNLAGKNWDVTVEDCEWVIETYLIPHNVYWLYLGPWRPWLGKDTRVDTFMTAADKYSIRCFLRVPLISSGESLPWLRDIMARWGTDYAEVNKTGALVTDCPRFDAMDLWASELRAVIDAARAAYPNHPSFIAWEWYAEGGRFIDGMYANLGYSVQSMSNFAHSKFFTDHGGCKLKAMFIDEIANYTHSELVADIDSRHAGAYRAYKEYMLMRYIIDFTDYFRKMVHSEGISMLRGLLYGGFQTGDHSDGLHSWAWGDFGVEDGRVPRGYANDLAMRFYTCSLSGIPPTFTHIAMRFKGNNGGGSTVDDYVWELVRSIPPEPPAVFMCMVEAEAFRDGYLDRQLEFAEILNRMKFIGRLVGNEPVAHTKVLLVTGDRLNMARDTGLAEKPARWLRSLGFNVTSTSWKDVINYDLKQFDTILWWAPEIPETSPLNLIESWNFDSDPLGYTWIGDYIQVGPQPIPAGWTVDEGNWSTVDKFELDNFPVSPPHMFGHIDLKGMKNRAYARPDISEFVLSSNVLFDSGLDFAGGFILRRVDPNNYYYVVYSGNMDFIQLAKVVNGTVTNLEKVTTPHFDPHVWYNMRAEVTDEGTGTRFRIYFNNTLYINHLEDPKTHPSGKVGLYTWRERVFYDNIEIYDLSTSTFISKLTEAVSDGVGLFLIGDAYTQHVQGGIGYPRYGLRGPGMSDLLRFETGWVDLTTPTAWNFSDLTHPIFRPYTSLSFNDFIRKEATGVHIKHVKRADYDGTDLIVDTDGNVVMMARQHGLGRVCWFGMYDTKNGFMAEDEGIVGTYTKALTIISNIILWCAKKDQLIPLLWFSEDTPKFFDGLLWSINGGDKQALLWLSNDALSAYNLTLHLNPQRYGITDWCALDVTTMQIIAKGSGTDLPISVSIPAKSWKTIYILPQSGSMDELYSNIFIKSRSISFGNVTYTLQGPYNQTSWLVVNSTITPYSVTTNNTGALPKYTSLSVLNASSTLNGWYHDSINKLLYVKFRPTSIVEIEIIQSTSPDYTLASLPLPFVSESGSVSDTFIIIPISDPHGPSGPAHTMDTMGGVLIACRLGLNATSGIVKTAMDTYSYISTYDPATAKVTMTDTTSHLIVLGSPGVNQVAYYYNELRYANGTNAMPVLFLRDATGDYLYVQSSGNEYRIGPDAQGRMAEYGVIQLYRDGDRYVILVYGLGGESTKAAAKAVAEFDQWGLTGTAVIVKYYDSDGDGYLDTTEIVETVDLSSSTILSSLYSIQPIHSVPILMLILLPILYYKRKTDSNGPESQGKHRHMRLQPGGTSAG